MKRKVRILELARVGKWGLDGSEITKRDIAELAETTVSKRPVIIGHDVTDRAPKFGDVLDCWLSADGNALVGCVSFSEAADKLYENGAYDGWSISMPRRAADGKRILHHLAILGAVPPKIPGLAELAQVEVNYGEGAIGCANIGAKDRYQFSGQIPEKEGNDTMTEEEKKAMAEKDAKIAELEAKNKALEEQAASNKEAVASAPPSATTLAKPDAPVADNAVESDAASASFADMQRKVNELEAARRKERLDGFGQRIAGKLPAGVASKAKSLAEKIEVIGSFDFADNGKTEKRDALQLFEEIIQTWPAPVKTGASGINYGDCANSGAESGDKPVNWGAAAKKM